MMWHRRETRRPTENTKLNLRAGSNLPTHPIRQELEVKELAEEIGKRYHVRDRESHKSQA